MIHFFRRIRQGLLSQNRFSKYLLYAIGEILLVVIGILIALQVSNWNEERKLEKSEFSILKGLNKEFKKNIEDLNISVKVNSENIQACMRITELIRKEKIEEYHKELDSLLGRMGLIASFDANTGVTDQIISSGNLNILRNETLREKLTNWLAQVKNQKLEISFTVDNYNFNLMPYLLKYFPLSNAELYKTPRNPKIQIYIEQSRFNANMNAIDLMQFENVIWHHKHNIDFVLMADFDLLDSAEQIQNIISSELSFKSP
jgi:hypothetical protein